MVGFVVARHVGVDAALSREDLSVWGGSKEEMLERLEQVRRVSSEIIEDLNIQEFDREFDRFDQRHLRLKGDPAQPRWRR